MQCLNKRRTCGPKNLISTAALIRVNTVYRTIHNASLSIPTHVYSAQFTAVIKAAKAFLQMFTNQCCSIGKLRKKLQHESYQRQHTPSQRA